MNEGLLPISGKLNNDRLTQLCIEVMGTLGVCKRAITVHCSIVGRPKISVKVSLAKITSCVILIRQLITIRISPTFQVWIVLAQYTMLHGIMSYCNPIVADLVTPVHESILAGMATEHLPFGTIDSVNRRTPTLTCRRSPLSCSMSITTEIIKYILG